MGNTVEYGIRINVEGNRASAAAIDEVRNSTAQLGATAERAGASIQASQTRQASATAQLSTNQAALNETLRPYAAQLDSVTGRQRVMQDAVRATTQPVQQLGVSAAQTAAAMRQVPAQFTDIITSLQGGQAPLTVLLQQGGQLKDMFGGVGNAVRAMGSYIASLLSPLTIAAAVLGVFAFGAYKGAEESKALTTAIVMTGNAVGTTTDRLAQMSEAIGKTVGTQGAAAEALAQFVTTGRVGADNLERFAAVAVQTERTLDVAVKDTVANFADLARAPVESSKKLNETYRYLTASVYEQITALTQRGKTEEAADVAQKAFADALSSRSKGMVDQLGWIAKGWREIKDAISGVGDALLTVGRKETLQGQVTSLQSQIESAKQGLAGRDENHPDLGVAGKWLITNAKENLQQLRDRQEALQEQLRMENRLADVQGEQNRRAEAGTKWVDLKNQYLTKQQQKQIEIERATNTSAAAGAAPADLSKVLKEIESRYADLNNAGLVALENQRDLQKEVITGQLSDLESFHKRQLVSDAAYVAEKRDLDIKSIDLSIGVAKKEADIASGKDDLTARNKYLGQLAVLQQQRANILKGAQNALDEYVYAGTKAIGDLMKAWVNASVTERAALADETALFGKSAEARKIATEQLKVDAEVRQFVINWQKQGHVFTEQETADIKKAADARKGNIAAIMGERQALAGADQLRQENQKFLAESIVDEQARAARLLEIDANTWQERIRLAGDGTVAQRLLQEQFDQWYSNRQMAPTVDRWKTVISNLDNDFRQGFKNMLEHGHDAWKSFSASLGNTLKASLADALYQTFIKKYIVQIVTSLAGSISGEGVASLLGGQSAGGTGNAGGAIGAAQMASTLYKAVTTGFEGIGTTVTQYAQQAINTLGVNTGQYAGMSSGVVSPFASAAGTVASYAAGAAGGKIIGSAISGQYGIGDHGSAVVNIGTAIGAIWGPMGAALGGAIGGLVNRAFGMGAKEVTQTGIRGTLSDSGVKGENFSTWHQDGGWFRSDKSDTDTSALSADISKQFVDGLGAIKSVSSSFAQSLGVSADSISSYSKDFNLAFTKDATANQKVVADFFNAVGDELATKLVPNIATFSKSGETAAATLQRLGSEFQATDTFAKLLGKDAATIFGALDLSSAAARERMVALAGGIDQLGQKATFYAQNFLSEDERIAPVVKAVGAAMSELGLASITTKYQFKAQIDGMISSGALATAAGAELFNKLMELAPAFAQVADYTAGLTGALNGTASAAAKAKEQRSLDIELMDALGNAEGALSAKRKDALDALLSDRARVSQAQIWAAQDAAAAIAKAQETSRVQVDAARNALTSAYQRESSALQSVVTAKLADAEATRKHADALKLSSLSPLSPELRYQEARRQLERASGADKTAAASAFLEASQAVNASSQAFSRDFDFVQEQLKQSADASKAQATAAAQQLTFLDQQVKGLIELNTNVVSVRDAVIALSSLTGGSGAGAGGGTSGGVAAGGTARPLNDYQIIDGRYIGRIDGVDGINASDMGNGMIWDSLRGFYQKPVGSHKDGLSKVPYDGYMMEAHYGEAVVDAQSVAAIRRYFNATPAQGKGGAETAGEIRQNAQVIERQNELLQELIDEVRINATASSLDVRSLKQHLAHVIAKAVAA